MKSPNATSAGRVRTPTVLQMESLECGAASLAMILAYYGRYEPLERLRVACGVSRDGSRALYIVRAARQFGLEAKGFRKGVEALKTLPPPYIAFWEHNHFLVVEGFRQGKVYLNDPAMGPRVVSEDDFARSYSGVVLVMEPGPEFEKGGQKPSIIPGLKSRLRGNEWGVTYVAIVGLMLVVPGVIVPNFLRSFVDNILLAGKTHWLGPLLLGMLLTALLLGALTWLQGHYLMRLETRMAISTSAHFFWHVLRLPLEFFAQRFGAEVGGRVQLNDNIAALLGGQLATSVLHLVTLVFYLAMMLWFSPVLTVVGVVAVVLNLAFLRYMTQQNVVQSERLLHERGKEIATAMAGLQAIETLKASGSETDFFIKWAGYHAKTINLEQRVGVITQYLTSVPTMLTTLTTTAILILGGVQVISGKMSVGTLVAFQSLMQSFMAPVNGLVNLGSQVQQAVGDMNRLEDVLKYPVQVGASKDREFAIKPSQSAEVAAAAEPNVYPAPKLKGYVELKGITFGYNRLEPPLIEDFNLSLYPGMRVALVGGSGSGKSTLARLVAGLYEPWSGSILFDGRPRNEWPRAVLYNSISVVDQEIRMFQGSVRDNVTLWDETIPEAELIRAAKDACIHDDIAERQAGYSEQMSEGGINFSGGQRQRLEIARALVTNPSIMILDEATSALDPRTEHEIDLNLRRRGCACIIVAHRLSTIRDCDEIIVLEKGRVVQRGTHASMVDEGGPYAQLIASY